MFWGQPLQEPSISIHIWILFPHVTLSQPPPGSSSCPSPGTIALPWLPILWGQKISMLQKSKMLKPSYSHQTIQINVHSEVFILIDVRIPAGNQAKKEFTGIMGVSSYIMAIQPHFNDPNDSWFRFVQKKHPGRCCFLYSAFRSS